MKVPSMCKIAIMMGAICATVAAAPEREHYFGALTESPYVVDGALNLTDYKNGSCAISWAWQHDSDGTPCVPEGGLYACATTDAGGNITVGTSSENYYTFEGSRFSNGGKDGRQQGYAGDIRNPTEAVGTFRVVRDGAPGPPCVAPGPRRISWWFDVAENATTDALNAAAIKAHRDVFSRVMPYNAGVLLDGNVSRWWGHDAEVAAWNGPLQALGVPVLPYLVDTSNSTQMHLVYANQTAVVRDAVAIAEHYGFQGPVAVPRNT